MEPQIVYLWAAGVATVIGIAAFIWRAAWWTSDQFRLLRDLFFKAVHELEDKFDRRHEDNIVRFTKLETKLDIVIKNGH